MFRAEAISTAILIAIGSIGGLVYNLPVQLPQEGGVISSQASEQSKPESPAGGPRLAPRGNTLDTEKLVSRQSLVDLQALNIGDQLLTGGNFIGAHQHYLKLQASITGQFDASVLVRIALSAEMAGLLDNAETFYRETVQWDHATRIQKAWALLGTARVWRKQGRIDEAAALLSELSLLYGTENYPEQLRLPVLRLLSETLQDQFDNEYDTDVLPNRRLAKYLQYHASPVVLESVLAANLRISEPPVPLTSDGQIEVLQNPLNDLSLVLVDARLPFISLQKLVRDLSEATEIEIQLSEKARTAIAGRSVQLDSESIPVPTLLDQTFGPLGLIWEKTDRGLRIVDVHEVPVRNAASYALERIQRTLDRFQLQSGAVAERAAVLMHDANICMLRGQVQQAGDKLVAARDLKPVSELSAKLFFNTGFHALLSKQEDFALDQFYRALDQTLESGMQAAAYCQISQLELNLGRPDKSIAAATRSLRLSDDSDLSAQSLMVMAKANLVEADPYTANKALFDNRQFVTDPSQQRMATLLSSYAQYQVVRPQVGLQNQGERLVLSLVALEPKDTADFLDHLIVGRAYYDVGFRTKALNHLQIASTLVSSPYWRDRIGYELAEVQYLAGDYAASYATLSQIKRTQVDGLYLGIELLRSKALRKLGQPIPALELTRELLSKAESEDMKIQVLRTMGEVFQQLSEHRSAALCFAGLLPDDKAFQQATQAADETGNE